VCGAAVDDGAAVVNRAKVVEVHAERDVLGVDPRLVGDDVAVAQGGEVVKAHLEEALGFSSALVDDAAVVNGFEDVEAHAERQALGVDLSSVRNDVAVAKGGQAVTQITRTGR